MRYWSANTEITRPTERQLKQTLKSEKISFGWIAQLENNPRDFVHAMAYMKPSGEYGFYLERRGPKPDEWFEGITPGRARIRFPRPWWQFWRKDTEIHLFERKEMVSAFSEFLAGETQPRTAKWSSIPPSYED